MEGEREDVWSDGASSINDAVDSNSDDGTDVDPLEPPVLPPLQQMRPEELHEVWRSELQQGSRSKSSQMASASGTSEQAEQDLTGALRARFMQEQQARTCSDSTEAHDSLMPVPEAAIAALQLSLAGPWSSRHASVRLWSFFGCYHGFCGGYGAYIFIKNFHDPHYAALMWTSVPVWGGVGIMAGEATAAMARALVQSGSGADENLLAAADGRISRAGYTNLNYIVDLLHSPVSVGVADRIADQVRQNRALVVVFIIPLLFCYLGMLSAFTGAAPAGSREWVGVDWFVQLVLGIGSMCCFPCAVLLTGWGMFISVPCLIVSDRIRRETSYVTQMQESSAANVEQRRPDCDRLMNALSQAHDDAVRLGVILRPTTTTYWCIAFPASAWWIALGSTNREGIDPTSPVYDMYVNLFPPWFFFVAGAAAAALGFYPLIPLATISKACDELVEKISELKSDGCVADGTGSGTRTPAANDLVRIDGLVQYVSELNCHQGIGILMNRRRIDSTFVQRIVRAWVVFALVLCLAASTLTYQGSDRRGQDDNPHVAQAVVIGRKVAMLLFAILLVATLASGVYGVCRLSSLQRREAQRNKDRQARAAMPAPE